MACWQDRVEVALQARTVYVTRNRVVLGSMYSQRVVRARSRSLPQNGDSDSDVTPWS